MSADDCIRAHYAVADIGQVHRATLAGHQAALTAHELTQDARHRGAARQCMSVAPISAEAPVPDLHCGSESGGDRLLSDRQVTGALDQILQKQVVGAFLQRANLELTAVEGEPRRCVDLVNCSRPQRSRHLHFFHDHFLEWANSKRLHGAN